MSFIQKIIIAAPNQLIESQISKLIDELEEKHGPVDRSEFDGEFVVPPEIRNRANSLNSRRLHGGLLNISRSRTFLTLPINNSRSTIHGSVPDLSRSVPNTPNTNHKLSLASSYDSVLEEVEPGENGTSPTKGTGAEKVKPKVKNLPPPPPSAIEYVFTSDGVQLRRKSEDILSRTSLSRVPENNKAQYSAMNNPVRRSPLNARPAIASLPPPSPAHVRQSSEPTNRLIPVRAHLRKPTNMIDGMTNRGQVSSFLGASAKVPPPTPQRNSSSSSLYNIHALAEQRGDANGMSAAASLSPSRWGNVRGSNSFSSNLSVNNISTYTIPRVSLHGQKLTLHDNDMSRISGPLSPNSDDSAA
jgi:hypothetical protein